MIRVHAVDSTDVENPIAVEIVHMGSHNTLFEAIDTALHRLYQIDQDQQLPPSARHVVIVADNFDSWPKRLIERRDTTDERLNLASANQMESGKRPRE